MNRRRFVRQPISLSALVHPPAGRSWLCTVRDFCQNGMLLVGTSGRALSPEVKVGDVIALHFSVPTPSGQAHFRTQAVTARRLDSGRGVGVQFPANMPEDAFQALMAFSVASGMAVGEEEPEPEEEAAAEQPRARAAAGKKDQPVTGGRRASGQSDTTGPAQKAGQDIPENLLRDRRIDKKTADEIRRRVHQVAERGLKRIIDQFFEQAKSQMLLTARDSGTNAMQMMYFEGLDQLEKSEQRIREGFKDEVLRQIKTVSDLDKVLEQRRRRESGNTQKLELVDTETFEDWLAVAEVISKLEGRYKEDLLDIRAQLGLIAKPWSHKDVVPIGPAVVSWAFDDAIKQLDLRRQVKQDVFRAFEMALVNVLGNLYSAVNQLLEDSGAFPSLEQLREAIQDRLTRRTASGVRVNPEEYQEMDASVREAAMAADGVGSHRLDYNPFAQPSGGTRELYDRARNILSLRRRTDELLGRGRDTLIARPDAPAHETFDSKDILDALSTIQREFGDATVTDQRLKPRLIEVLRQHHGDRKGLTEEDYDTLEVMEQLVDSIRQDQLITDGIRDWIQRLEITLNKLAARDKAFLLHDPEEPHSAIQMLNQLARLGASRDTREGIDREVGSQVETLLQRVVSEYDQNPEIINEVVSELTPLVDRQSKAYRGNIERTVRASEGQQKLARARRTVVDEIQQRVEGRKVPELLLQLLNPGWRNLLVHTHLRHGPESNEWRDALAIVDQLAGQLGGDIEPTSAEYVDPERLLKRVVEGLNGISFDPSKRTPLVMRLSSALVGDTTGEKAPVASREVEPGSTLSLLGLEGLLPEVEVQLDTEDEGIRENWQRAVERARRIQVGEWLATSDAKGRPLILSVAFIGDDFASYVLVNRKGVKSRELTLQEMADSLHSGQITLLEDYDLPLMERASQRMLENMHNQLAYQASHDDLTELINRKEFERQLKNGIDDARRNSSQHALYYVDLDQFKIINNTSGHTAGDELLKQIGDALMRALQNEQSLIGRLGGDEFGVIVHNAESQRAREIGHELLNVIRNERFEWEGRVYSLSASIGLVFVDAGTENVDTVMQFADEACFSAKDAGRNRMLEYELVDAHMMQRHGVMEWVTQLDKALEEERLVLNCQRIMPMAPSEANGADHYEILLTMRDELGDMMPPTDFITAAETYNRMTTVDRWVIERVLDWMSDNRAGLDHVGMISINVSGHSVNDETFPDFVLEQFSRSQAPTGKVCFEITETAAIANLDNAIDFMNRMKIIGCQFSLDDFGTGLSSYSYLRNLPVDYVKIDGVFVRDIANNPGDYAVVRSINEIGHYMGKKTIAEFVEDDAVLDKLREIGVDYAQGYRIDRPKLLEDLRL